MDFTQKFENKVLATVKQLANKSEKILVACSGGKDSTSVLFILHKYGYNAEGLMIDLHIGEWSKKNIENVRKFCGEHEIKLNIVDLNDELGSSVCFLRERVQTKAKISNCMICGVMKRWLLNKKARELGAAKLATGHNLDDEAETIIMNFMKGNPSLSLALGPKVGVIEDSMFVPRIKPLYFCLNADTRKYSQLMGFPVEYSPCPCSTGVFRRQVREMLAKLEKDNPKIKENTVRHFLKLLPRLREKYKERGAVMHCEVCGEPSRNKLCRLCTMLKVAKC